MTVEIEVTAPPCSAEIEVDCAVCETVLEVELHRLSVPGSRPPRTDNVLSVHPCPKCCAEQVARELGTPGTVSAEPVAESEVGDVSVSARTLAEEIANAIRDASGSLYRVWGEEEEPGFHERQIACWESRLGTLNNGKQEDAQS